MTLDATHSPSHSLGVMVSSTFTDLEAHRAALIKAINAQDNLKAIVMENDSAKPVGDVLDSSLGMVRKSAGYVGVISHQYGQIPDCPTRNPDGLSLTELEFNAARDLGRPILLFIMGDGHAVKPANVEKDPEKAKRLEAFRESAKRAKADSKIHRVYKVFNDLHEFEVAAMQAVAELSRFLEKHPPFPIAPSISSSAAGDYGPHRPAHVNVPFPPKGGQLVGRQDALLEVRQHLTEGLRTAIGQAASFQGLGGLGKTQLAVEYAHRHRGDYPQGVVWLTADQELPPQLIRLADESGWTRPEADHALKLQAALQWLQQAQDCLLIFDNLEAPQTIADCLPPATSTAHILVTSRLDQPGFHPIDLSLLSPEEGLALLLQGAGRSPQGEAEQLAALEIVKQLDGLPLALELAGAYLKHRKTVRFAEYRQLLQEDLSAAFPTKLQGESFTQHEANLYSTLKIHQALLDEEPLLGEVLDVLTWSGTASMSVSLLSAMLKVEKPTDLTNPLSLGCAVRILQQSEDGERYAIQRLVRQVRRLEVSLRDKAAWAQDCVARLENWFEARKDGYQHLQAYEAEMDHLLAWQENAKALGWFLDQVRLTWLQAYPAWHWGRYREAKTLVELALALYEQYAVLDEGLQGDLFNDLGWYVSRLGDIHKALVFAEKAFAITHKQLGEEHSNTAISLNNIAEYYYELGYYAQALEKGELALSIKRKIWDEEVPSTALSLLNISKYHHALGHYSKALDLGEKALAIFRQRVSEKHPYTALSLHALARYHHVLGQYSKALELSLQDLALQRQLFGDEHPDTGMQLNNVARIQQALGDYTQALALGEQALAMVQKAYSEEHPRVAQVLADLAKTQHAIGSTQKALECSIQALEMRKRCLGEEHPRTAESMNHVASCYLDVKRQEEAFALAKQAMDIRQRMLGKAHPDLADSFMTMAACYQAGGDHGLALSWAYRALTLRTHTLGVDHPDTAKSMDWVSACQMAVNNMGVALEMGKLALDVRRRILGNEHPDTLNSLNNVAALYGAAKQWEAALALETELYEVLRKTLSVTHQKTVHSHRNLIFYLANTGYATKALKLLDKQLSQLPRKHSEYEDLKDLRLWLTRAMAKLQFRSGSPGPGKGGPKRLH